MKLLLTAINAKYIHSNLAVRYLKEFTKDLDYECLIKEFTINDRKERIVEEIMMEKPDIVAFSCYIWNIEYVKYISNIIKIIDPNIEILYGGPEVSYNCKEFLQDNSGEFAIEGEGEETYKEFIEYKLGKRPINEILGIYYKKEDNNIGFNGVRKLIDMSIIKFPYHEDEILGNKIIYYEASRGCPFGCKYCLSSTTQGVRFLDIERVKRELKYLMDKQVRLIKFVDRTFNCNTKFAKAIWNFIAENESNTTFHFEISADLLKDDEIEILNKIPKGRIQFEVGVQSTNDKVLENIDRKVKFEDLKEKVLKIKNGGNIKQHLDLIAGLPGENFDSFKNSFNDVYSIRPEEIQLGFLKLLRGSSMRVESSLWGIKFSPYAPYEILKSNDISYEELVILKQLEEMVDKYYNSGKFKTIIKYFEAYFDNSFEFYQALSQFFLHKGYFNKNISSTDYYKVFLEFNEEFLNRSNKALKEIVKFDYLSFNKKKWLPDFLERDWNKIEDRRIRGKIYEKYKYIDTNRIHIEKFSIDILKFLSSDKYIESSIYYMFNDINGDIKDVSDLI